MPAPKRICNQSACQHKGKAQPLTTSFYRSMRDKVHGRDFECKDCKKKRNKREIGKPTMTKEQQQELSDKATEHMKENNRMRRIERGLDPNC